MGVPCDHQNSNSRTQWGLGATDIREASGTSRLIFDRLRISCSSVIVADVTIPSLSRTLCILDDLSSVVK